MTNTEIDIVLETPERLYIGEAKFKSGFNANGSLVLVHQFVRQYVMATVLLDVLGCTRKVVPFVVTERPYPADSTRCPHQVKFVVRQGWMDDTHILTWEILAKLASGQASAGEEMKDATFQHLRQSTSRGTRKPPDKAYPAFVPKAETVPKFPAEGYL